MKDESLQEIADNIKNLEEMLEESFWHLEDQTLYKYDVLENIELLKIAIAHYPDKDPIKTIMKLKSILHKLRSEVKYVDFKV